MTLMKKMRRAFNGPCAALVASLLAATIASAHHSSVMYDDRKEAAYDGTIVQYKWGNPHTWVFLDVPTKKGLTRYSFEMPAPSYLKRYGWTHSSLKPGDKVKVVVNPSRDGTPGGQVLDVIFPDGKKLDAHQRLGHYEFDKDGKLILN